MQRDFDEFESAEEFDNQLQLPPKLNNLDRNNKSNSHNLNSKKLGEIEETKQNSEE